MQLQPATNTMLGGWSYSKPVPVLILQPEQSAYAVVEGTDNPVGAATKCPAPFTKLKVVPPGNSAGAVISAWLPYADAYLPTCSGGEVSVLLPLSGLQR
jgi:hypothetical protein